MVEILDSENYRRRTFLAGIVGSLPLFSGCTTNGVSGNGETPHLMITNRTNHSVSVKFGVTSGETVVENGTVKLEAGKRETYYDLVDDAESTYTVRVETQNARSTRKWSSGTGMLKAEIYDRKITFTVSMA